MTVLLPTTLIDCVPKLLNTETIEPVQLLPWVSQAFLSVNVIVCGVVPVVGLTSNQVALAFVRENGIAVPVLLNNVSCCWVCPSDERVTTGLSPALVASFCADAAPAHSSATAKK